MNIRAFGSDDIPDCRSVELRRSVDSTPSTRLAGYLLTQVSVQRTDANLGHQALVLSSRHELPRAVLSRSENL
jgi:hypothetical protein